MTSSALSPLVGDRSHRSHVGRNLYNVELIKKASVEYYPIGRKNAVYTSDICNSTNIIY